MSTSTNINKAVLYWNNLSYFLLLKNTKKVFNSTMCHKNLSFRQILKNESHEILFINHIGRFEIIFARLLKLMRNSSILNMAVRVNKYLSSCSSFSFCFLFHRRKDEKLKFIFYAST